MRARLMQVQVCPSRQSESHDANVARDLVIASQSEALDPWGFLCHIRDKGGAYIVCTAIGTMEAIRNNSTRVPSDHLMTYKILNDPVMVTSEPIVSRR